MISNFISLKRYATRRFLLSLATILSLLPLGAERRDSVIVSLLTCWPGAEVYELCGHEAIRVRSANIDPLHPGLPEIGPNGRPVMPLDSVWNYGTFDFAQPNFIYRFVKGETDYMVCAYPTSYFFDEYRAFGRRVEEQDLNLSQDEAHRLLGMLRKNALPENRTYRYNYVKDNCATRILTIVDHASDRRIIYPDSVSYGTFRNTMRHYHRDYPWYQFGIDLALGSGIDYPLTGREEMFVPTEMHSKAAGAHFEDGTPLVAQSRVINQGVPDATLGPTPWYLSPLFICLIFLLFVLAICWAQYRKQQTFSIIYSLWFLILGLTGCLIAFLVFISTHEATSPNLLILWLNPLQLIIALGVWFRKAWRVPVLAMTYVNIIILTVLLIVWPMQQQSANPAFFPLMGATLALAVCYAIINSKTSYNNNGKEVGILGAAKRRSSRSSGAKRRTPTSGGRNRR